MCNLVLLTSPPASGKTFWIESFCLASAGLKVLVISPLRALRDECLEKWGESILVMTPEEWMMKSIEVDIVIFDEFHLYFFWGDSFRPQMWEVFYDLASSSKLAVLLTATWNPEMQVEFKKFEEQFEEKLWLDFGNQVLKTYPVRYVKLPARAWVEDLVTCAPEGRETALIFCAYREEVFAWGRKLREQGYRVWTCVGGEAKHMRHLIKTEAPPDYIVSTTVLSHGVNLPVISKIYFFYELGDIDFWIHSTLQNIARLLVTLDDFGWFSGVES